MSLRWSPRWPRSSSGAMYGSVPAIIPSPVNERCDCESASIWWVSSIRARPKSSTFAPRFGVIITFVLLRSR